MKRSSIKRALRGYVYVIPLTLGVGACATEGFDAEPDPQLVAADLRLIVPGEPIPERYIVRMVDQEPGVMLEARLVDADAAALLFDYGGDENHIAHFYRNVFHGFAAEMTEDQALALLDDPRVASVEQDGMSHLVATQSNPTWGLDRIDQTSLPLSSSYTYSYDGTGVYAYVVDTGIYTAHTQFGGRATSVWSVENYSSLDSPEAVPLIGKDTWKTYRFNATATPTISISGGTGDIDLYVKKNAEPTTASYDCRPYLTGNNETCNGSNGLSGSGIYYVTLRGYSSSTGVTLTATPGSPYPSANSMQLNSTTDVSGHGTHVAGTIGSSTYGVAKNVNLRSVRVFRTGASIAPNSDVTQGLDWIKSNAQTPAVVNMSLSSPHGAQGTVSENWGAIKTAVDALINANIQVVAAAGNDNGANACNYTPGDVTNAITVAATTSSDAHASYSNGGSCVDLYAPGSSILSTSSSGGTTTMDGTSMAAPHVTGAVALYLDQTNGTTSANVRSQIINGATSGCVSGAPTGTANKLLNTNFSAGTCGGGGGNSINQSNLSGSTGSWLYFSMPANATPTFTTSGGTGDADLYVRKTSNPTLTTYNCRSWNSGNSESCSGSNGLSGSGTYKIGIYAYSTYSGLSLSGHD